MKTITELREDMRRGELTCEDLIRSVLKIIQDQNPKIHAVLSVSETALQEAKEIDLRRERGDDVGVLGGIPLMTKDNMCVQGWENTSGSQILEGYKSAYNATVVERLKQSGAILIGRTNMDEFAMGSSTENSHFGPTKNPWDFDRVPGGSSGGSAASVAAGFVPASLGSDTGGSIRQPASLCGVVGLKPTYGRVSRYGLMALASSFDQIGPFARTVEDVALVMQVIEGKDAKDSTSVELSETTVPELVQDSVEGLTLGVPDEYFLEGMDEEIKSLIEEAIAEFERGGACVKRISMPHVQYALSAYYIIMPCEASSNLGRFDGLRYGYHSTGSDLIETYERSRGEGFGAEVKRRIMLGSFALSAGYYDAYYRKALKVRTLIKQDFDDAFRYVDAIVTPTSPSVAWNIGEKFADPLTMYLSDIYTVTANLATVPAMSIPCGFSQGLPIGLQLMSRPFDEYTLYRLGNYYQKKTVFHLQTPL